jgi:hypothetical protein
MPRRLVMLAVAVAVGALVATAPSAQARPDARATTGCTPRVAFTAVERLFAAINAGSTERTLAAMTPPRQAGWSWVVRVQNADPSVPAPRVAWLFASPHAAPNALWFDSPRAVRTALRARHAAGERLALLAVRVGKSVGVGIHRAREASVQVLFARSAADLPPSVHGYSGTAWGHVSCTHGTVTTLSGTGHARADPLAAETAGHRLCRGRHKAVHLAGRGWACH